MKLKTLAGCNAARRRRFRGRRRKCGSLHQQRLAHARRERRNHLNVSDTGLAGYPGVSVQGVSAVGLRFNVGGALRLDRTRLPLRRLGCGPGEQRRERLRQRIRRRCSEPVPGVLLVHRQHRDVGRQCARRERRRRARGHPFLPPTALTANLYQVDVSIRNLTGAAIADGDLVYRRVMDWDIEPTSFSSM